jgi:hypothetical protein
MAVSNAVKVSIALLAIAALVVTHLSTTSSNVRYTDSSLLLSLLDELFRFPESDSGSVQDAKGRSDGVLGE